MCQLIWHFDTHIIEGGLLCGLMGSIAYKLQGSKEPKIKLHDSKKENLINQMHR